MTLLRILIVAAILAVMATAAPASAAEEVRHFQPRAGRTRPVVVIVGLTAGTETTDFIIPWSVLTQSGGAEVYALGTDRGPIRMMPALKIQPQMTIDEFDAKFPGGPDYLVIPAVHDPANPRLIEWVRAQARKGATAIAICDGVWVAANAGLLQGHRATAHWYSLPSLEKKFTGTMWVRNQRYVSDGSVVTTTGVTASIPASLAMVEAIAGHARAMQEASELGVSDWSTTHRTADFHFSARDYLLVAGNELAFWSHQNLGVAVSSNTDEIALALIADAYSRTWRSRALTVAPSQEPLRLRRGLTLIPDLATDSSAGVHMLPAFNDSHPVTAMDWALAGIARSYGQHTAHHVALQMEYPRPE